MLRIALFGCSLVLGCSFDPSGPRAGAADGGDPSVDATSSDSGVSGKAVSHVADNEASAGTGEFSLGNALIDTTAMTIDVSLPSGVTFESVSQVGGGPDLAVLRVAKLTITVGSTVRVIGDKPLVVIAGGSILIVGTLDATARLAQPGASGASPDDDLPTRGGPGQNDGNIGDSGGGGGGFANAGAAGGDAGGNVEPLSVFGGVGGSAGGDATLIRLQGGGAGGVGSPCMTDPGGGGGGAIQLSSLTLIQVSGVIGAGGGGGGRGYLCPGTGGSAGGGGAGGAIFLEAPTVEVSGVLAANGGGGGSGSDSPAGQYGFFGANGSNNAAPAPGGTRPVPGDTVGVEGGAGGALSTSAGAGASTTWGNGGGGGGSVGRIVIRSSESTAVSGIVSPAYVTVAF